MCMSLKKHYATEKRSALWCLGNLQIREQRVKQVLQSVNRFNSLTTRSVIFEIGCAQGLSLFALKRLGYTNVSGIEPSDSALKIIPQLSKELNIEITAHSGYGENLNLESNSVDLIIADSVLEHVYDDKRVLREAYRVLKPNGVFYFETTSTMCPKQNEIRFFPFFSWYPDVFKKKIMIWSQQKHPSFVGYTDAPAINWYFPRKIKRLAFEAGFRKVINRWQMLDPDVENTGLKDRVKRLIASNNFLQFLAGFCSPASIYLLIK